MPTLEQKGVLPPSLQKQEKSALEKKEASSEDAMKGFEDRAETIKRALAETQELAKKDPEKAAAQQKHLESQIAGYCFNVRVAQASETGLGDTPQEIKKNSKHLDELAENLGGVTGEACVYFCEKMLPEFKSASGIIETKWLEKGGTDEIAEERDRLSERLRFFIDYKIRLAEKTLESPELKKTPKEEMDILKDRLEKAKKEAEQMLCASDALRGAPKEKAEKAEKK